MIFGVFSELGVYVVFYVKLGCFMGFLWISELFGWIWSSCCVIECIWVYFAVFRVASSALGWLGSRDLGCFRCCGCFLGCFGFVCLGCGLGFWGSEVLGLRLLVLRVWVVGFA